MRGLPAARREALDSAESRTNPGLKPPATVPQDSGRFARFALFVLLYNLAAVAWGVFVRAGKYGDGCGSHWPLCDGDSTPLQGPISRVIEASHRVSTGLCGPIALILLIWAWRKFPKGHIARWSTVAVLAMTGVEGLIGAALVKWKLVVTNDSAVRAAFMAAHAVSTFLLVGSIALTLYAAAGLRPLKFKGQSTVGWILGMAAMGVVILGVSGSVSALGHQLHQTPDVLKAALNPATHWMVRLQPLHPLIAVSVGLYLFLAVGLLAHLRPDPMVKKAGNWVVALFCAQASLGVANIWLKAPIAIQMGHLALADINWISLVVLGAACLQRDVERVESRPAPEGEPLQEPLRGRDLVQAYIALTKPRVISLLLFTTLTSAIAAKGGWPGLGLFSAIAIAGYMAAGAANAINMVVDRDIDFTMKRTRKRPTVSQSIPSRHALTFAFTLAAASFAILWGMANLLSAVLALGGLVFYVVIYTMLLKRRTWHNIVIGGAAGAFPPLVGWAAVSNSLPPLALYLFAIVFVWTPVHFWALALLLKDDYAAAGVPMLPVVKGERNTVLQIAGYTLLTVIVTLLPFAQHQVGWLYALSAVALNTILVVLCIKLYRTTDKPRASGLFHFSMLYLAILFLMVAIDRAVVIT